MSSLRHEAYRNMWILVFFDLPTNTKKERKNYAQFRKGLKQDGFTMLQYSIYLRHSPSRENAEVHIKRVKSILPPMGEVGILRVTDKQFEQMLMFHGSIPSALPSTPQQLELF